jgi:aerobic carbon-monoxide dehydrogenase medium subunit
MIPPFQLHRPGTVAEASSLLGELGDEAALYCGGTELLQVMKMGIASFGHLIDVKAVKQLSGMTVSDDGVVNIGATVTHREIELSPLIRNHVPALAELARQVANVRVRNSGSIGGNLCFAEPHSDPAVLLVAADASVHLADSSDTRTIRMQDFTLGPLVTAREPAEVLVRIEIPAQPLGTGLAYRKVVFHERPAASVAVRVTRRDDEIASASVVVGSVGDGPTIVASAGEVLVGASVADPAEATDAAAALAASECDAYEDINGSEDYKRHLVAVLSRRAIGAALEQAGE